MVTSSFIDDQKACIRYMYVYMSRSFTFTFLAHDIFIHVEKISKVRINYHVGRGQRVDTVRFIKILFALATETKLVVSIVTARQNVMDRYVALIG